MTRMSRVMRIVAVRVYAACRMAICRMILRGFHQCSKSGASFGLAIETRPFKSEADGLSGGAHRLALSGAGWLTDRPVVVEGTGWGAKLQSRRIAGLSIRVLEDE